MAHSQILNEEIVDVLFNQLAGQPLSPGEKAILEKWLRSSVYNRSVFNDVTTQQKLRDELMGVCYTDRSQFWNIVIRYRTALHPGFPYRRGNFWVRCLRWTGLKNH
jgi:hypothetical protein